MGSRFVVLLSPEFDRSLGVLEAQEPVLAEALVTELPVEALDVRILDRSARTGDDRSGSTGIDRDNASWKSCSLLGSRPRPKPGLS